MVARRSLMNLTNGYEAHPKWASLATEFKKILLPGGLLKYDHMKNVFNKARDLAGKHQGQTLHSLRHATITRLENAGIDGRMDDTLRQHRT